jgi:hypothetical protein
MAVKRMDNVGIVVENLDAAIEFFGSRLLPYMRLLHDFFATIWAAAVQCTLPCRILMCRWCLMRCGLEPQSNNSCRARAPRSEDGNTARTASGTIAKRQHADPLPQDRRFFAALRNLRCGR